MLQESILDIHLLCLSLAVPFNACVFLHPLLILSTIVGLESLNTKSKLTVTATLKKLSGVFLLSIMFSSPLVKVFLAQSVGFSVQAIMLTKRASSSSGDVVRLLVGDVVKVRRDRTPDKIFDFGVRLTRCPATPGIWGAWGTWASCFDFDTLRDHIVILSRQKLCNHVPIIEI